MVTYLFVINNKGGIAKQLVLLVREESLNQKIWVLWSLVFHTVTRPLLCEKGKEVKHQVSNYLTEKHGVAMATLAHAQGTKGTWHLVNAITSEVIRVTRLLESIFSAPLTLTIFPFRCSVMPVRRVAARSVPPRLTNSTLQPHWQRLAKRSVTMVTNWKCVMIIWNIP